MNGLGFPNWGRGLAAFVLPLVTGGCGLLGVGNLIPGTYVGELSCRIVATNPEGVEGQDDFTYSATLVVDEDGGLTGNGEPIEVGEQVTREIPTATLSFEVTRITRGWGHVLVSYEPRPTLPGISVTGDLVEDYRQAADVIRAHGLADLVLTDFSGDSILQIDCSGVLAKE